MGDSGLQIALWLGDGIIGPSPVRAVVLDGEGRLVAVSPRSKLMTIQCKAAASCTVWDRSAGRAYRPDAGSFQTRQSIMQGEMVVAYPEDYDDEFGFATRQMTAAEMLGVESRALFVYPVLTLIAGLWWAMIWVVLSLGPMFLRRGDEKLFIRILAATATTGVAIALWLFSFILWSLAPSTQTILLAHMVIGGMPAWLALRVFRRRRRNLAAA